MHTQLQVRLTKLSDNANGLRTATVVGFLLQPPVIGESLTIIAESLDDCDADYRQITTSTILSIDKQESTLTVVTRNSTYRLEFLGMH